MTRSDQSPSLPVLPSIKRRRAAAARQSAALSLVAAGVQPPSQPPAHAGRYAHVGLIALCMTAVALVAALVIFSILRDQAALRRPAAPIALPLQP